MLLIHGKWKHQTQQNADTDPNSDVDTKIFLFVHKPRTKKHNTTVELHYSAVKTNRTNSLLLET